MAADDEHGTPTRMEQRVAGAVTGNLLDPVLTFLQDMRRLLIYFAVVLLVVAVGLQIEIILQNNSRNHVVKEINKNTKKTTDAADEAKKAAEKASADVAAAIAGSQNTDVAAAFQRMITQVDCIAHQRYPCP